MPVSIFGAEANVYPASKPKSDFSIQPHVYSRSCQANFLFRRVIGYQWHNCEVALVRKLVGLSAHENSVLMREKIRFVSLEAPEGCVRYGVSGVVGLSSIVVI